MVIYNANYWELYSQAQAKQQASSSKRKKIKKKADKIKVQQCNTRKKEIADGFAEDMREAPSALEEKMQCLLDNWNVEYQFQKVFYIKKKSGKIKKFYIADFYIPSKSLIIETDGAFHQEQIKKDEQRTRNIQKAYPNIKVVRWRWYDFDSYIRLKELQQLIK